MAPLVVLTTVHGSFAAHVLAARLTSEGIDVDLRGGLGGAYGLTVGDLARVDLYVREDQIDDARLVMLASEVDAAMTPSDDGGERSPARIVWPWVIAALLLVAAVAAPVLRVVAD